MRGVGSASEMLRHVEAPHLKKKLPKFGPGDTLRVTFRVLEAGKERQQAFEGVVVGRRGGGTREMVSVRKMSFGVGVERTFPLHSPFVVKLEVVGRGKVRRAKLYYLRERAGKAARLRRRLDQETETAAPPPEADAAAGQQAEAAEQTPAEGQEEKGKGKEKAGAKAKT